VRGAIYDVSVFMKSSTNTLIAFAINSFHLLIFKSP
jgi:hypothetical protein